MSKKIWLFLFLPAIAIALFGLFVQIIRYEPLYPKETAVAGENADIPIFDEDPILGSRRAGITLIAFEDFGCAACRDQHRLFTELIVRYPGKIKIIWKGLPVTRFPVPSDMAHRYAFCANEAGRFEAFAAAVFEEPDALNDTALLRIATTVGLDEKKLRSCLASPRPDAYIQRIEALAEALQIQSVPAVFMGGAQIDPPTSVAGWAALLKLESTP